MQKLLMDLIGNYPQRIFQDVVLRKYSPMFILYFYIFDLFMACLSLTRYNLPKIIISNSRGMVMLRLNSLDLTTIFGLVDMDGDGIQDAVNYLNMSPDDMTVTLAQLAPSAESTITSYLQTASRAARAYLDQVNATVIFATKMCLLMNDELAVAISEDDSLHAKYLNHTLCLRDTAKEIFMKNNLDAQLYFLIKIATWRGLPVAQDNPNLKIVLDNMIQELACVTNQVLPLFKASSAKDETILNYVRFIKKTGKLPNYKAWLDDFIKRSRSYLETILFYNDRHQALKVVRKSFDLIKDDLSINDVVWLFPVMKISMDLPSYKAWLDGCVRMWQQIFETRSTYNERNLFLKEICEALECIKADLSLNDINWLIRQSNRVTKEFEASRTCYRTVTGDVSRFGRFMVDPVSLGVTCIYAMIVALTNAHLDYTFATRAALAGRFIEHQEMKEQFPDMYTPQEWQRMDKIKTDLMNANSMSEDSNAEKDMAEFRQYLILFLFMAEMLVGTGISYFAYRSSRFFKEAQPTPPTVLPSWCNERRQELQGLQTHRL